METPCNYVREISDIHDTSLYRTHCNRAGNLSACSNFCCIALRGSKSHSQPIGEPSSLPEREPRRWIKHFLVSASGVFDSFRTAANGSTPGFLTLSNQLPGYPTSFSFLNSCPFGEFPFISFLLREFPKLSLKSSQRCRSLSTRTPRSFVFLPVFGRLEKIPGQGPGERDKPKPLSTRRISHPDGAGTCVPRNTDT